jgi:NADH:ubiquinone reductase (H+-translocating)
VATQQQVYGRLALEALGSGFAVSKTGGPKDVTAPATDLTERRSA